MVEMTVTQFAKKLREVFDRIEHKGEEIVLMRNKHRIARIIPGSPHLTAIEAMGDLYHTLPEDAGKGWLNESRIVAKVSEESRNPWE